MIGNDCTKFGALVRSVTILPNTYHKAPDYYRGCVEEEGAWEAGGILNPLLGLFGLATTSRSANHRPKHA